MKQFQNMTDFEKLIKFLEGKSYGDLIMPIFELTAIVIGLLFVRRQRVGIFFLSYLTFDLIMWVCDTYVQMSPDFSTQQITLFVGQTNILIALFELSVYFYFFSKILRSKAIIRIMTIVATVFTLIIIVFTTTRFSFLTERFYYVTNLIEVIEFVLLVPPCLLYFHELFNFDPIVNLSQRPSFWIVTGIFFCSVISVPFYLLDRFLTDNRSNYWSLTYLLFFSIPFSVNFIFLTKAFLCKKPLTL